MANLEKPTGSAGIIDFMRHRPFLTAGATAACAAMIALGVFLIGAQGAKPASPAQTRHAAFKDDRTLGNPNAPVVFVEYAAPTCSHCAHFTLHEMPGIKKDFIDTGKVFYVFRVFPLQPADGAVEGVARCLPAHRYFPFMERMFGSYAIWYSRETPDVGAAIVQLAAKEGLSAQQAKNCMTDSKQFERLNQVSQDAELKYQVDHTPFFVINNEVVPVKPGEKPGEVVRKRIRSLLAGQHR